LTDEPTPTGSRRAAARGRTLAAKVVRRARSTARVAISGAGALAPVAPSNAPATDVAPANDDRTQSLDAAIAELREAVAGINANLAGHVTWMTDLEHGIGDVREAHGAQLADVSKWLGSAILTLSSLSTTPVVTSPALQGAAPPATRLDEVAVLRRQLQVWSVRAFLQGTTASYDTPISVVMPTRNRALMLREAIASVLAQRHTNFELVVVDDGSTDETPEVLAAIDDPRVRVVRTAGLGESFARNLGLDAATGDILTFLDDDNLMDPGWLHAVAWAFDRWPETNVLYGARIIEDAPAMKSQPSGALPNLDWEAFDRRRLEQGNYIDMNTIALRPGLDGLRFDESLHSSIDWQLMLTLTAQDPPFELPAIACVYRTYAPNRICDVPERLEHNRRVRARVHTTRPMRVLSHNAMFPLVSETYIHEEMSALEANGAEIAFNSSQEPVSRLDVTQPVWHDLYEAVQTFDPDVLFVYWATHAYGELQSLERIGRPFALRVHSFDFDPSLVATVQAHPLCVGVWAYPHHVASIEGAHAMVPLFHSHESMPAPAAERNLVLSVSAGLPKKNWPLLFDAMERIGGDDALADLECGVVLARSNGFEHVPDEVIARADKLDRPPFVEVNLPRAGVFDLLARTSVLLYTLDEGERIGMPMSLIEAMRAGACVVHPDREDIRPVVGPAFRGYRTVEDIVAHVREIHAGGAAIDAERERNQQWARDQYGDPARETAFHHELSAALERWRFEVG
jgi:glycosyltransferase involved in cell wall biosynthesis